MNPATLPPSFRSMAHACTATNVLVTSSMERREARYVKKLERRREIVNRVCDRAKKLSDEGKLTGKDADAIADQIYGSSWLWLWVLWEYRALIWQAIRLLAELAQQSRSDSRPRD
jgi:hypothetical protein